MCANFGIKTLIYISKPKTLSANPILFLGLVVANTDVRKLVSELRALILKPLIF